MEDLGIINPNAGQQVGSDAGDDGFGSFSSSAAAAASPDSSLSPFENDGFADIEKLLGSGMNVSDFAVVESLESGMELTDDEADNAGDFSRGKKRRKRESKTSRKRLSLYQVYYLEKHFKIENKLDLEKKYELAKDLGLKPRQVTIWFQNRRARSKKNKDVDLNIDFDQVLKQYDALQADYVKLLEENKSLKAEMKDMRHEMVIMKDSLLKYGKLVRAGLLAPQVVKTKSGQVKRTKQLQVGQAQLPVQTISSPNVQVYNVSHEGVVAPNVLVQQQLVNSPVSENSVFDSNSPLDAGAQLLPPLADYPLLPVLEPEPVENNANYTQADQQDNSISQGDTIDYLIHKMVDLDEQNGLYHNDQADDGPQTNLGYFTVNPMDMDDEASWDFKP